MARHSRPVANKPPSLLSPLRGLQMCLSVFLITLAVSGLPNILGAAAESPRYAATLISTGLLGELTELASQPSIVPIDLPTVRRCQTGAA